MKSFIIVKNDYKEKENQPDFILKGKIDGVGVKIGAGWKKVSPQGTSYIAITLQDPKDNYPGFTLTQQGGAKPAEKPEPDDDESWRNAVEEPKDFPF